MLAAVRKWVARCFECVECIGAIGARVVLDDIGPNRSKSAYTLRHHLIDLDQRSVLWTMVSMLIVVTVAYYHLQNLQSWISQTTYDFDAVHTYFPLAKEFLAGGWQFLLSERAISVPPVTFLFPAVLDADPALVRGVNIALSVSCVFLIFRTGFLVHSRLAGVIAAFCYGASPHFWAYNSTISVEPLAIWLNVALFWVLAEAWRGAAWGYWTAGLLFATACMTRATMLYFLPLLLVAIYLRSWFLASVPVSTRTHHSLQLDEFARGLRNAALLGLLLVVPLLLKNFVLWGVPAISTGAGIALLSGSNPLTWGFESNYFNIDADSGLAAARGLSHLHVTADASMAVIGKQMLLDTPLTTVAHMYLLKTAAFLFGTNREWLMPIELLRGWRVVLFGAAAVSLLFVRRRPLLLVLWAFVGFQILIHMPVLYLHRYSVPALDVPLALLAGAGVALALFHTKLWLTLAVAGLTAIALWLVPLTARDPTFPVPNVAAIPHRVLASYGAADLPVINSQGFTRGPSGTFQQTDDIAKIELDFSGVDVRPGVLVRLDLRTSGIVHRSACEDVKLRFRERGTDGYSPDRVWYQRWPLSKGHISLVFGGLAHIRFNKPGYVLLEFNCKGASIDIERLELIHPLTVRTQRDAFFQRNGVSSWAEWYEREQIRGHRGS
jgi:hypothetical protein